MNFSIPFYNLLNMLLIGVGFGVGCMMLAPDATQLFLFQLSMALNDGAELLILSAFAYLVGLIINRISSVIVEDIVCTEIPKANRNLLSRIFRIEKRSYTDYQKAEKKDVFIKTLSREYALSRNCATLFLLLAAQASLLHKYHAALACASLVVLFYLSMKKHTKKIVSRIDYNVKRNKRKS